VAAAPDAENLPFFALRPDVEVEDAASAVEDAVSVTAGVGVVLVIEEEEVVLVIEEDEVALTAEAGEGLPGVIKTFNYAMN